MDALHGRATEDLQCIASWVGQQMVCWQQELPHQEAFGAFNIFDVCVVLGLSVRRQDVSFDSCIAGLVNNLFDNKDITIEKIVL